MFAAVEQLTDHPGAQPGKPAQAPGKQEFAKANAAPKRGHCVRLFDADQDTVGETCRACPPRRFAKQTGFAEDHVVGEDRHGFLAAGRHEINADTAFPEIEQTGRRSTLPVDNRACPHQERGCAAEFVKAAKSKAPSCPPHK